MPIRASPVQSGVEYLCSFRSPTPPLYLTMKLAHERLIHQHAEELTIIDFEFPSEQRMQLLAQTLILPRFQAATGGDGQPTPLFAVTALLSHALADSYLLRLHDPWPCP